LEGVQDKIIVLQWLVFDDQTITFQLRSLRDLSHLREEQPVESELYSIESDRNFEALRL
jgi:hypothetical protein